MKNAFYLWTTAILAVGTLSFGTAEERGTLRTRLCDFWQYSFQTNTYTCSYLTPFVNLVTATDADVPEEDRIAKLENRIHELEKKIEALEKD